MRLRRMRLQMELSANRLEKGKADNDLSQLPNRDEEIRTVRKVANPALPLPSMWQDVLGTPGEASGRDADSHGEGCPGHPVLGRGLLDQKHTAAHGTGEEDDPATLTACRKQV